jgi:hypothetical protein
MPGKLANREQAAGRSSPNQLIGEVLESLRDLKIAQI